MRRYVAMQPIVPNKRIDVLEKDEKGYSVGAWYGYWNYKKQIMTLYPNVRNRYVNWPNGKIPENKIVVSDSLIYRRTDDYKLTPFRGTLSAAAGGTSPGGRGKVQGAPSPSPTVPPLPEGEAWGGVQQQMKFY